MIGGKKKTRQVVLGDKFGDLDFSISLMERLSVFCGVRIPSDSVCKVDDANIRMAKRTEIAKCGPF